MVEDEIDYVEGFTQTKLTEEDLTGALAMFGLVLAIICFLAPFAPFKKCFNSCGYTEPDLAEENYDKICLTFSTDYDKENPLTNKQGQLRMLNHQIKKAEEDGDESTVAALKA